MDNNLETYQYDLKADLKLDEITKGTIWSVAICFFITLLSWFIDILVNNLTFSFSSVAKLHIINPLLFFFDILPVIVGVLVNKYLKKSQQSQSYYEKIIREKDENILRNARFAQMIGKKEFAADLGVVSDKDELGKALILMRNNLALTDIKENELNWIARGKDQISDILRQHNNIQVLAYETLIKLIKYINAIQGSFYIFDDDTKKIVNTATFAYNRKKFVNQEYTIGQGLIGQAAYELELIYRREIPENYVTISSGILGDKKPKSLIIIPLISDSKLQGIIEIASLEESVSDLTLKFVREIGDIIGQTIFNLKVNSRTERLLKEAQNMTETLQQNEAELRQNAVDMRVAQEELEKTNRQLEGQIEEVENAQKRLYSLLENASEVITIYDEMGMVKYISPSVKHILGFFPEDLIGKNAFERLDASTEMIKRAFNELLETPEEPRTFEYQFEKSDTETLWLEATGRNLLTNPAISGIIFNIRDITVRKIAEKAQRMSGQMQALSENSVDMIMRIGIDGVFYYANPIAKVYTNVEIPDIIKHSIDEVKFQPELIQYLKNIIPEIKSTHTKVNSQLDIDTKFGVRIMQVNAIPEFNEEKELETILYVSHDITEQKRIEQVIKDKNKAIGDSINYAQRIQSAILPDNKMIQEYLPKSFILYKPRDIVSGDFPWFLTKGDEIYIAVVDCTGHGVPGAMLSFIAYFLLNNIVDHDRELTAGQILDILHARVRKTLKQDQADANARDGMDIAFCKISLRKNELQYAGAHRPLYYMQGEELMQYKGNPMAIGGIPNLKKADKNFTNYVVDIKNGDKAFFFSDGIVDQIGGPEGKKYQAIRIRDAVVENKNFSMSQFSDYFAKDFLKWKGDIKQIDDVLLIGIEF